MKKRSLSSGLFAVCFVLGVGCASADDVAPTDDTSSSDDAALETEGDLGTSEQAITMPIEQPGPATQCVSACTRYDVKNISGLCCICNGAAKKFAKGPVPNLYLCK